MKLRKRLLFISLLVIAIVVTSISLTCQSSDVLDDELEDSEELLIGDINVDEEDPKEDYKMETALIINDGDDYDTQLKLIVEKVESENSRRSDQVASICKKYGIGVYKNSDNPSVIKHPPTPQYSVFYFDRVNHFTFCPIYKAGSSTWLYNMLLLGGMKEQEVEDSNKQLSEMARALYPVLDPTTAEMEFQTSMKILTVRHPFERVLSAYRDKLENINYGAEHGTHHFYRKYGSKIVSKYRAQGNNTRTMDLLQEDQYLWDPSHPKPAGVEPTFQEFVMYLIGTNIVAHADDHWIPFYLFCTPCLLQYNFIAKVETMDQDQSYIIRSIGLNDKIKPKWRHKTQFTDNDNGTNQVSKVAQIYFRQLTSSQILKLFKVYQIDFELFDYDFKPYLKYARDAPTFS